MTTAVRFDMQLCADNVTINDKDVSGGMRENASFLNFYGGQESNWNEQVQIYKTELAEREAEVAQGIRESATGKVPAQGVIDAMVILDEKVKELKRKLFAIERQASLYKNAVKAFTDRGNNIRSLNSSLRAELQSL